MNVSQTAVLFREIAANPSYRITLDGDDTVKLARSHPFKGIEEISRESLFQVNAPAPGDNDYDNGGDLV